MKKSSYQVGALAFQSYSLNFDFVICGSDEVQLPDLSIGAC